MEVSVDAPPGVNAFDVGIELRNLQDQPIAQAVEIGSSIQNTPLSAPAGTRTPAEIPPAGDTYGGPSPRRYQLIIPPTDGCFYFLKVVRPQAGGTFTTEITTSTAAAIAVDPAALSFDSRCLGSPSPEQWVTIHNAGTADLIVSNLDLTGPAQADFSLGNLPVLPATLQPGAEVGFTLRFNPTQLGTSLAEVVITCNDETRSTVIISATGTGQEGDVAPPQLQCPSDIVVWTCADGASVQYAVSATDDCDTNLVVSCTPVSGSWFALGTNQVACSVTSGTGQMNECSFTVTVLSDTEPPTIYCPSGRVVNCMGATGALVYYPVEASDNSVGSIALICAPASGTWFPIGETMVTCQAIDSCGNVGQSTFPVIVRDSAPVPLAIAPTSGQMRVTWPASCLTYTLQTSTNLATSTGWSLPQDLPLPESGGFSTTSQPTNSSQFFRLQRDP
jgi:hypothetical protein